MNVLRVLLCLVLAFFSAIALAQGVYVTQGKNGPIFSNVPQPGAKELDLKPINVIAPPVVPASPAVPVSAVPEPTATDGPDEKKGEQEAVATYRSFFVVYPENDGAVALNSATIDVRLAVDPPLLLDQRHAFAISLNGRPIGQRYTSTEFTILTNPPELSNDLVPLDNQTVQLDASIVDGEGRLVKQAEPVRFVTRRVVIRNHQRPLPSGRPLPDSRHGGTGTAIIVPEPKPEPQKKQQPMQSILR